MRRDIRPGERNEELITRLYDVWVKSVQESHTFLTEEDIKKIAAFVPAALKEVPHLIVWSDTRMKPVAFMGIDGRKLEMLFIIPKEQGCGLGKDLLRFGIEQYRVNELCVNEQNSDAVGFYEHMGFKTYKRSDLDEQGNPYPILYMQLAEGPIAG